jgi:hypothetical protein
MYIEGKDKKKLTQRLKELLIKEESIMFAYLHGSFLNEEEFNDVDIALYLDEKAIKEIEPVDFELSLSLKIGKYLKVPVDIKILNYAPLSFRYQVTRGYLLVNRLNLKREEFLCKTWSDYFDFQPIARIYLKEVLNA